MRVAKGGESVIVPTFTIGIAMLVTSVALAQIKVNIALASMMLSLVFLICTGFLLVFFRDPDRKVGGGVVSPADGRIIGVDRVNDDDIGESHLITVFMNVWNVHVNRAPFDGTVSCMTHYRGRHAPAFLKQADGNEKLVTILDTPVGRMKMVQVAGMVARRIVPYIHKGEQLKKGQRIGIIRFGSRVDLYLPCNKVKRVCVHKGITVRAGEDTVAEVSN